MEATEILNAQAAGQRVNERIAALEEDNILTRQLVAVAEFMKTFNTHSNQFAYESYHDAVLEHGTYKHINEYYRPDYIPDGEPQACFANAASIALSAPEQFTYVEGYACTEQTGIAMPHAWVEDVDGNIIDNTWDCTEHVAEHGGTHYCGIKFSAEYLLRRVEIQGDAFIGLLGEDWTYLDHMMKGMVLEDGVVVGERDA